MLLERQYLGEGYIHRFKNDLTGRFLNVPCTKEEYEALALPNPTNPTLGGHTWVCSAGGTIKVDTPDTMLGDNEFCVVGDKVLVNEKGKQEVFRDVSELQSIMAIETE